jgi:hypothetical protein
MLACPPQVAGSCLSAGGSHDLLQVLPEAWLLQAGYILLMPETTLAAASETDTDIEMACVLTFIVSKGFCPLNIIS